MDVVPGVGIDFTEGGQVLALVLGLYLGSALVSWRPPTCSTTCAGVSGSCPHDVERKINRLPLRYFDSRARGDLLSRVTNDIDNVSQPRPMSSAAPTRA